MRKLLTSLLITAACAVQAQYPITPVPFTSVKVSDAFWSPRLKASREVTIPLAFSKCEETGRYRNFEIAARQLAGENTEDVKVGGFSFDDTDVYKTIEGASYILQTYPDKQLAEYIDSVLAIVAKGQEPDGYLYTARTMNPKHPHEWAGSKRWEKVEILSHEFYNLGHMLEAACAHYQATGKRNFLDIAIRYADCVEKAVGPGANQLHLVPGHQIAEMGLCKLYLVTGERKYLNLAKYFLDMRGKTARKDAYSQAHKPVTEQDEAVGHAVRAEYMYSGMADVAALTGDSSYIKAIDKIWSNIVNKKLYITGGVGARHAGEAFGADYELPNASAYCETCAQIGNVYTNYRLFLLHGFSCYYDILERTLYNALISGVSIEGDGFFYPNPLSCREESKYARQPWFGCACCPSNICRFIPSLPGYIYATKRNTLYVNLFMGNTATIKVDGRPITIQQETQYPADGDVKITLKKGSGKFAMYIRVPSWVTGKITPQSLYRYADGKHLSYSIKVNGKLQETISGAMINGYAVVERKWNKGDVVDVHFDMEPRLVVADKRVTADRGRVAIERGPLVYCAEWPDNEADISTYLLNQQPQLQVGTQPITITEGHTVTPITAKAQSLSYGSDGRLHTTDRTLTLIPYYAWDHRGQKGGMDVWLPIDIKAASATHIKAEKQADNGFFGK